MILKPHLRCWAPRIRLGSRLELFNILALTGAAVRCATTVQDGDLVYIYCNAWFVLYLRSNVKPSSLQNEFFRTRRSWTWRDGAHLSILVICSREHAVSVDDVNERGCCIRLMAPLGTFKSLCAEWCSESFLLRCLIDRHRRNTWHNLGPLWKLPAVFSKSKYWSNIVESLLDISIL